MSKRSAEDQVRRFYDDAGWAPISEDSTTTVTKDAQLWEDLRPCAREYVSACRLKLLDHLPKSGDRILDAASGPIQYPEYLEYSAGFKTRVCVDISQRALDEAKKKIGNRGEFVKTSILDLPFETNSFDAVVSLHTIYHIAAEQQEAAVRQLIRVAKPGAPVVIVYSNPNRLFARIKRAVKPTAAASQEALLYFHAHPNDWWSRFSDECKVELHPWRGLTAQDSKRLIPSGWAGKKMLSALSAIENSAPRLATELGAYPMIVLKKNSS